MSSLSQQYQIYIYRVSEAMDTRDYGGFILQNNPELREIAEGLNIFPGGGGGGGGGQGCPQFLPGGKTLQA